MGELAGWAMLAVAVIAAVASDVVRTFEHEDAPDDHVDTVPSVPVSR